MKNNKTNIIVPVLLTVAVIVAGLLFVLGKKPPIKAGILFSFSGSLAMSESQLADAVLLAVDEINTRGGLLGRTIQPVIADAGSDLDTYQREAERLVVEEKVDVIFGGYTSASRKRIKTVVEAHNKLLFYPLPYEGIEESENIVYNGSAPNQQYIPALKWCFDNLGSRFYLVGSDYIWPRVVIELLKDLIHGLRGEILGEDYILLGSQKVDHITRKIHRLEPQVVLSFIVGTSNIPFFDQLHALGITAQDMPVMAFAISEVELTAMDAQKLAGNYSCWSYFQSVDSKVNREFVVRFKKRYGDDRVINASIEAGYFGVYLWAQAIMDAGTAETDKVRAALGDQSFEAPGGIVFVDAENLHTWKISRIGRIQSNGQFDIVWSSQKPIRPVPYPIYRSKAGWNALIEGLYREWGNAWANPGSAD